jgi:hypothetical protein
MFKKLPNAGSLVAWSIPLFHQNLNLKPFLLATRGFSRHNLKFQPYYHILPFQVSARSSTNWSNYKTTT